jgi:putative peptide zinc metalloprotease protein
VRQLADERLRPLGVLAGPGGASPEVQKLDPMLALKFKAALVPERVVNAVTTLFKPLYFPPVVLAVLAGLVVLDVWLFAFHGIAQSMREVLYSPALLMLMLGLVIVSAAFHESGHATACAYGGARPGVMGAGIYIVWPAFYTDVTDAYRLDKRGRLRTDLGGIYFNTVFMLVLTGVYFATGWEPLLLFIPFQHLEILHQLLPFIRLDGYYIVSDLTGVPDMFSRIRPTLESLLPWRGTSDKVRELKPWVRFAVSAYVLTVVPLLLFMFALMVINAPRILATAWDSFFLQYYKVQDAFGAGGSAVHGVIGSLQMVILLLPAVGLVVTFGRVGLRLGRSVWQRTEGDPLSRVGVVTVGVGAAVLAGYTWWPNGEYRPIQRGERGTIQGAVAELSAVPSGRPALTKRRAGELGGAPFRNREKGAGSRGGSEGGTSTTPTKTTPKSTTQTATTPGGGSSTTGTPTTGTSTTGTTANTGTTVTSTTTTGTTATTP